MIANRILTELGYEERIRSKLGVSDSYLPDTDINQPDVITIAEANVISQIPEYATLTDDLKAYLELCVVLECCILLCPSMAVRLPKKEAGPHASQELAIDWDKKKAEYEEEKEKYIMTILDTLFPQTKFGFNTFTVTYPKRGW